ncbi:MAG: Gfo/Idh/MocA family oxidoreductase, partial [Armatimonadota bacterium]|nr:Gfo/Idh/MocA family oxidoreductase [Armatimonadota bacterium]
MTDRENIRGAVIGYGGAFNMGRGHLNWMKEAGITPTAACDLDKARVKVAEEDFPGIRTYSDIDKLLADGDVDLITIITPHNT